MESQSRLHRGVWESTDAQDGAMADEQAAARWRRWVRRTLASVEPAESPEDEEDSRGSIRFIAKQKAKRPPDGE